MHLMKLSRLVVIGVSALIVVTTAHAQSATPIARVNGVVIPQSRLDFIIKARVSQGQPDSPEVRRALREDLIAEEVISQEALRKGLDRDPDVVAQLEIARQTALVRAYQIDYIKTHPVSDEALRKEYEELKVRMGDKEYKARHVLVSSERTMKTSRPSCVWRNIRGALNRATHFPDLV